MKAFTSKHTPVVVEDTNILLIVGALGHMNRMQPCLHSIGINLLLTMQSASEHTST